MLYTFFQLMVAIFLEAAPFLLLGSVVAAIVEEFTDEEFFRKLLPRRHGFVMLTGLFAGLILPTCECGIVPVVRKLLSKGVPPAAAVTYMFAAPVINPVVILSTYVAFQGDTKMVAGRLLIAAVTAVAMGWFLGGAVPASILRNPDFAEEHGCSCCHHGSASSQGVFSRVTAIASHATAEFFEMSRYLLLGAFVTALFKISAPMSLLDWFQGNILVAIPMMMILAIVLSVCSEADAFVAASFSSFPQVSLLAFIGIGPMVDLKLLVMYAAVFKKRIVADFIIVPILIVFGLCLILADWIGM